MLSACDPGIALGRRSDGANYPFGFKGAAKGQFVRTGIEIATAARDFQADDEGSIPFTRSNVFDKRLMAFRQ